MKLLSCVFLDIYLFLYFESVAFRRILCVFQVFYVTVSFKHYFIHQMSKPLKVALFFRTLSLLAFQAAYFYNYLHIIQKVFLFCVCFCSKFLHFCIWYIFLHFKFMYISFCQPVIRLLIKTIF